MVVAGFDLRGKRTGRHSCACKESGICIGWDAVIVYKRSTAMPYRVASLVLVLLCLTDSAPAQSPPPIRFLEKSRIFVLDAGSASYLFGINEQNALQHIYWGGHVLRDEDFLAAHSLNEWASFDLGTTTTPQEYPGWGAGLYVEPSLKVTFPDGNRDLVLGYVAHRIDGET